jgi:adenylate cyclase
MKRKIAAILAADAAEYSRLVAEDEEATLRQLVASFEVFKASIESHGGRIFNTAGDAVLAEFQSAVEAVRAAIDIQETLCARNEAYAPGRRMMFRMGISIGDVVENGDDLLGDGVNIAARLQSLSQPGGLAISRWVQEQVAGKVGKEFRDTGYQLVKNMPAPIHVFQSSIAVAGPADREVRKTAPAVASARWLRIGSLAAGIAVIAVAIVIFALSRREPSPVAIREIPPASAKQEAPAPIATTAPQSLDRPALTPQPEPVRTSPDQNAAPKEERASVEPSAPVQPALPPSAALPSPSPSAREGAPPALVPDKPEEAAVAPPAAAPESGQAATLRYQPSPESSAPPAPVIAQETAADPKQQKLQCAEVLERAQLGELTSDDKAFLRSKCR